MLIPVLLGVTVVVFLMLYLTPGDPARALLGDNANQEDILTLRKQMGLDDPMIVQYLRYMFKLLFKGDLGISYVSHRPVMLEILARFPTTMLLTAVGVLISVTVGVTTGVISAIRQYSWMDRLATAVGLIGVSMPAFWLGLVLSFVFALKLRWLPATGFYGPKYWILPAITVGVQTATMLMRMTRSSMLEVVRQDYIRTARAKGLNERRVTMHHALRNSLIPIITVVGLQIGNQLGGAMVTETIFSIPGLGKFMVDSILTRDYPVVQSGVLVIALVFSVVNVLVDILYALVDPNIRIQFSSMRKLKRNQA
jgi:peptide/nickel transport system permease protein